MIEIPVDLGERAYTVSIGHGLRGRAARAARGPLADAASLVVSNRARLVPARRARSRSRSGKLGPLARVLIADGEAHKDARDARRPSTTRFVEGAAWGATAWWSRSAAASWATSRASPPPPTCAASTGSSVPTTLLAMVDSSVGGKVGINHPRGQEPDRRLPPAAGGRDRPRRSWRRCRARELQSGAYEVLKCGVLARPRALRGAARRRRRASSAGGGSTSRTRSPPPAASRPRSSRRTSARAACAAC